MHSPLTGKTPPGIKTAEDGRRSRIYNFRARVTIATDAAVYANKFKRHKTSLDPMLKMSLWPMWRRPRQSGQCAVQPDAKYGDMLLFLQINF